MLNYYTYYSIGGYKDMFLGCSESADACTYFLPLLSVWKKRATENSDAELAERVRHLEALPSIKLIKQGEMWGLPQDANVMISHGCYKLQLKSSVEGCRIFAISEISSMDKDEEGRSIPFLMLLTASSDEEKGLLAKFFAYVSSNMSEAEAKFASLFTYDGSVNGYRFQLSEMTKWINTVTAGASTVLQVNGRTVDLKDEDKDFIIKSSGIDEAKTLVEQSLSKKRTVFLNGNVNLQSAAEDYAENLSSIFTKRNFTIVAASVAIGLIAGLVIGKSIWGNV